MYFRTGSELQRISLHMIIVDHNRGVVLRGASHNSKVFVGEVGGMLRFVD